MADHSNPTTTRRLVRGSTLLLAGRLVSKFANFATQVLIVRYLAKGDFGAFTYALSIVLFVQALVMLGLDRSIVRFLPIYHERGDHRRLVGTLLLTLGTIVSLSLVAVLFLYAGQGQVQNWIHDPQAISLLYLLIFLAPLQAMDEVLIGVFAVFAWPRAIFFRRYVLAPGLKFIVVLGLIATGSDVRFLSLGYLIGTMLGLGIYGYQLVHLIRDQQLLGGVGLRGVIVPWREVFSFTFPLMTTELVYMSMNTVNVVLLERYWNTSAVANLQAVLPTAKLNELVMASFATLFTPTAARMFARSDQEGMNKLYWRTAIWIAVFSFPVFLVTFSLARPITVVLFGNRYESAAPILAMLSLGYYFNAALGFNGLTLKVFGHLRYVVVINVITALVSVALSFALIPRFGAIGAGIAMMLALILHNVLKQAGLKFGTGVRLFEWRYLRAYVLIVVASALILAIPGSGLLAMATSGLMSVAAAFILIRINADLLSVDEMFPELLRLPGMRWLLGRRTALAAPEAPSA